MQTPSSETSRKRRLEQKGAHGVVHGANHALSLAVLGGGIWARHAQLDTVREEEGTGGGVIELTAIVTLNCLDGEAELSRHTMLEVVIFHSQANPRRVAVYPVIHGPHGLIHTYSNSLLHEPADVADDECQVCSGVVEIAQAADALDLYGGGVSKLDSHARRSLSRRRCPAALSCGV